MFTFFCLEITHLQPVLFLLFWRAEVWTCLLDVPRWCTPAFLLPTNYTTPRFILSQPSLLSTYLFLVNRYLVNPNLFYFRFCSKKKGKASSPCIILTGSELVKLSNSSKINRAEVWLQKKFNDVRKSLVIIYRLFFLKFH